MSEETRSGAAARATCRVRVRGRVGPAVARSLPAFRLTPENGTTALEGPLPGSHSLVDLLLELQDLGLEVLDLERVDLESGGLGPDENRPAQTGADRTRPDVLALDDV